MASLLLAHYLGWLDSLFRFVRPVVYQNFPDDQLPAELQNSNPYGIERVINGVRSDKAIN